MIQSFKKIQIHGIGLFLCLVLSIVWWRLWMYQGLIGPIPFLHWFIWSDGEGSYDLTHYEMIIHLIIVFYLLVLLTRRSSKDTINGAA